MGKTWLVRDFAKRAGLELVELNFERDPGYRRAFESRDPRRIVGELSLVLNRTISPTKSLLFLDEVQAAGEVLATLRWFYEEMPELPVIAAGSLLEFLLDEHEWSMPVGRVTFRTLEPMGFPEFLKAHEQHRLLATLSDVHPQAPLSATAHEHALAWFQRYAMVGGMPAVVAADVAGELPRVCRQMQRDLVAGYRADFAKYSGRMDRDILDHVLRAAVASVGRKFVYARAEAGVKAHQAKRAVELLARAQLCHLVPHSAANGLPLGAQVKDRFRKVVLLDVGILHALAGTPAQQAFPAWDALASTLRGQVVEQLAGQMLRVALTRAGADPALYYWQRGGGRPGEIDYVVQLGGKVVPIELKAGKAGAMKSLHQFMYDKRLDLAVRCDANMPSVQDMDVKTTQGDAVSYTLVSLPHYLLWNLESLVQL